jgi:hypothetical protein
MIATQWIVIASLAAVIVSAVAIVAGLKGVRDQLRVTIFLEYTERYSKVMQNMPLHGTRAGQWLSACFPVRGGTPPRSGRIS